MGRPAPQTRHSSLCLVFVCLLLNHTAGIIKGLTRRGSRCVCDGVSLFLNPSDPSLSRVRKHSSPFFALSSVCIERFAWSCRFIINKPEPCSQEEVNESAFGEFQGLLLLLGAWTRLSWAWFSGVPHLGVSGPADLGSVWNPWHLSCIPGWIGAISVMDWGRRAGSRGWIRLNLYTGHMCAHDNMDAFFLRWVILIRLPGCCLEQPCFAAIFSLHQKRTMAPPKEGVNACFWNWRQKLL